MVEHSRRAVLGAFGAASLVSLAGCGGAGGTDGGDPPTTDVNAPPVDRTGQDEVAVAVGAGNGFAFDPAPVRIDAGTTVAWEWTGRGGGHNVVAVDESFESTLTAEAGHTFTHTFTEPGTNEYVCTPHQTQGMRGVVVVE